MSKNSCVFLLFFLEVFFCILCLIRWTQQNNILKILLSFKPPEFLSWSQLLYSLHLWLIHIGGLGFPNAAIGDWDSSPNLCNVKFILSTTVDIGKPLWIRVGFRVRIRECEQAIRVLSVLVACSHWQPRTRIPKCSQWGWGSESESVQCEHSIRYNCSQRENPPNLNPSPNPSPQCETAIIWTWSTYLIIDLIDDYIHVFIVSFSPTIQRCGVKSV